MSSSDDSAEEPPEFTDQERNDLQDAFNAIDVDHNGNLDAKELEVFMNECGLDSEFVPLVMKLIDKDNNQTVEFDEFLGFIDLLRKVQKDPTLFFEMLFKIIDKDKNEKLDADEIQEFVSYFTPANVEVTREEVEDFINEFDTDHDGLITYKEFENLLS